MINDDVLATAPDRPSRRGIERLLAAITAVLLLVGAVAVAVYADPDARERALETVAVGDTVPLSRLSDASAETSEVDYRIEGTMTVDAPEPVTFDVVLEHDADSGIVRSTATSTTDEPMKVTSLIAAGAVYLSGVPMPEGKRWVRVGLPEHVADNPATLSGTAIIDEAVAQGSTVTYLGKDEVHGVTADHYRVVVPAAAPNALEVWIADDGRIRRLSSSFEQQGVKGSVDLGVVDFAADVDLELPDPSEVFVP